jgi:hypothetical protein
MKKVYAGSGSHIVEFSHPYDEVGSLTIYTGLDRVSWGYSLNTANFPTYGGEVVQILSCFVDDLEVGGQIQTYEDIETIYTYFLTYMQVASQGKSANGGHYVQTPMKFSYPHRGWEIDIMPTSAPGFKKGRDVVAPEWRIQAHIVDTSSDKYTIDQLVLDQVSIMESLHSKDPDIDVNFGLTGRIGFDGANPFSDPNPVGQEFESFSPTKDVLKSIADSYNKLIPSYLAGDFSALVGSSSGPALSANSKSNALITDVQAAISPKKDPKKSPKKP